VVHLEREGFFDPEDEAERAEQADEHLRAGMQRDMANDYDGAVAEYSRVIRLMPNRPEPYCFRSRIYMLQKDYEKAVQDSLKAVELKPDDATFLNSLAWIMATCPEDKFRNGAQAVEHATKSCDLTGWRNGMIVDTLAAAYAETGDFQKAVLWQKRAIELGIEDPVEQQKMPDRLKLYQEGKPFRTD